MRDACEKPIALLRDQKFDAVYVDASQLSAVRWVGMMIQAEEILDAAYQAGVRYIDVARSYGRAESFLAGWLAARHLGPEPLGDGSDPTIHEGGNVVASLHRKRRELQGGDPALCTGFECVNGLGP